MTDELKQRIEMINRGEVPEGYKKTKVGIVPSEWEVKHFKEKFERVSRKNKEGNSNVLTISAQQGLISQEEFFNKSVASDDKSNYYLIKKGEYAYNKSYSNGYPYGALKQLNRYEKGVISPLYICFAPTKANKFTDYYSHYFEGGLVNREIQAFAQEGARNHGLLNIAVEDFFNAFLLSPPLHEQEKTAEILTTCDKVIALKEKLIAEKQAQKKWLMQNLLTGKKRLHGFTGEWEKVKLGDLCDFIKNGYTYEETISENYVMITRIETISNSIINLNAVGHSEPNIDNKFLLRRGDILFSHINSLAQIGKTAYFDLDEKLYHGMNLLCIRANSKTNSKYLFYWLNSDVSQTMYMMYAKKAVNQCSISASELLKYQLLVPSYQEQTAIANILSTADHEIKLLQNNLAEWENKKKGLMQLLLTGKVRTLSVNCG
jgi:type I restriction enzyme S subunit